MREGKILGQYVAQHFKGKKIAYFYQDDEFGMDGVKGLDDEIPASMVVSKQSYVDTNVNIAPQVAALRASGAQVVVSFSIPAFTALLKLNSLKLGFSPKLVVSDVGSDPITLSGLLESFAKQGGATVNGNALTNGIITDELPAHAGDTSNSWIALFKKIHDQYDAKAPLDGNFVLRHGRRLHVRAGDAQGGPEPDPGGPGVGDRGRASAGSHGRPVRLRPRRPCTAPPAPTLASSTMVWWCRGTGADHGHDRVRAPSPPHRNRTAGAGEWHPLTLTPHRPSRTG